jgi:hypothetical protein
MQISIPFIPVKQKNGIVEGKLLLQCGMRLEKFRSNHAAWLAD